MEFNILNHQLDIDLIYDQLDICIYSRYQTKKSTKQKKKKRKILNSE